MMMNRALLTSERTNWTTPAWLFNKLNRRFCFTLDPCCTRETALCPKYFTPEDDGLRQSWACERVFMNPPYGRQISRWVEKAHNEAMNGALVVGLIPVRPDTQWWQQHIEGPRAEIVYIPRRIYFGGAKNPAPFPSAIVVWWGQILVGVWR